MQIENQLVQSGLVTQDEQCYLKPYFAALIEKTLLSSVREHTIRDKIAKQNTDAFIKGLSGGNALDKALSAVESMCNRNVEIFDAFLSKHNLSDRPNPEEIRQAFQHTVEGSLCYHSLGKLYWKSDMKASDLNLLFLEHDDIGKFMEFLFEKNNYRSQDREMLHIINAEHESLLQQYQKKNISKFQLVEELGQGFGKFPCSQELLADIDAFLAEDSNNSNVSKLQESLNEAWDNEYEEKIQKIVEIFESCIIDGKFHNLSGKADQISELLSSNTQDFTNSVIGGTVQHGDEQGYQDGLAQMVIHKQFYEDISAADILSIRMKAVSDARQNCMKVDADFEQNPEFSGVMHAFKRLGDEMFAGYDMTAVREEVLKLQQKSL